MVGVRGRRAADGGAAPDAPAAEAEDFGDFDAAPPADAPPPATPAPEEDPWSAFDAITPPTVARRESAPAAPDARRRGRGVRAGTRGGEPAAPVEDAPAAPTLRRRRFGAFDAAPTADI